MEYRKYRHEHIRVNKFLSMYVIHKNIWYPISDFFTEHMTEAIDDFCDSVRWKLKYFVTQLQEKLTTTSCKILPVKFLYVDLQPKY